MQRPVLSVFIVVVLTALLAYWPGLHGQFIFDDYPNIVLDKSLFVNSLAPAELWSVMNGGSAGPMGRGLARLSFALNYYWSGLDPFAFKCTNLAIHLLNGYLVFLLAGMCLISVRGEGGGGVEPKQDQWVALFVSAVWMLHPIQLLPVLHVVQRMTLLAALFVFLAIFLHIKGRMATGYNAVLLLILAWLIVWPLGVFSKETALLLPVFAVLWELFVNRKRLGGFDIFAKCSIAVFVLFAGGVIWYLLSPSGTWIWSGYQLRGFTPIERVLTEFRVIWNYVDLIFLPRYEEFGLYHDDVAVSRGMWDPPVTALALLAFCAAILLSWLARGAFPLVAFGVTWFVAGHLLESTVLPLELMHEHRNYLPSFGLFLAVGSIVQIRFLRKQRSILLILSGSFLVYCIFLTGLRSHQFGSELIRSQIEAQHHRQSPSAHIDAGRVLANSDAATDASNPAYSLSIRHFEIASELDPKMKMGFMGMIGASCRAQVSPKVEWMESLAARLHDTPFAPGDQNVLYSLKELAIELPNCLPSYQVSMLFEAAATNKSAPNSAVATIRSWEADYYWLGLRSLPLARNSLDRALAINPASQGVRLKKVQLDFIEGNFEIARIEMDLLKNERLAIDEKMLFDELVPLIYGIEPMIR